MTQADERANVVAIAKSWLQTPFHHGADIKRVGVDCAQFISAVFVEAGLETPITIKGYSEQWYMHQSDELFLDYLTSRADEITIEEAKPADIVVYRFGRSFSHGGLIVNPGWPQIIHAFRQYGVVAADDASINGDLINRKRRFFTRKAWA